MLYDVIWCSMTKSAALAIMFHLNQTFLGPNCHSELNFSCPSAILWLDEQMVMFNLNSYLQMVKWSTALWFLLGHGRFNPGAIFTTMCQNLKPHPANKITQSAITKFHLRCQMLQTYKATSIIQRQIPPSIHIIRYQSNSKLINHHQSRGFLTNPISETSPMSHGFALALFCRPGHKGPAGVGQILLCEVLDLHHGFPGDGHQHLRPPFWPRLSGWWLTYPSEYEFVSWDDDIPRYGKITNVPNHQPDCY